MKMDFAKIRDARLFIKFKFNHLQYSRSSFQKVRIIVSNRILRNISITQIRIEFNFEKFECINL